MNQSYYQDGVSNAAPQSYGNTNSSYQANFSAPLNSNASPSYQNDPASSPMNNTTGLNAAANKQGQSTGAEGNGPDFICKILDKLEKKFGGERFNNHDNDAKNLAMNQKMSARIKTIGPMVMQRLPQLLSTVARKFM